MYFSDSYTTRKKKRRKNKKYSSFKQGRESYIFGIIGEIIFMLLKEKKSTQIIKFISKFF